PTTTTLPSGWATTTACAEVEVGPPMLVVTRPPCPKVGSSWPADGARRSSSCSRTGRARRAGVCLRRRLGEPAVEGDFARSHEENHMMFLLSETGLRYNENAIAIGAQTERRGLAGPVSVLLSRLGLTGRLSLCTSTFS